MAVSGALGLRTLIAARFFCVDLKSIYCYTVKVIRMRLEASALLAEGHVDALCSDFSKLPDYWQNMVKDFPHHPVTQTDPGYNHSIGCTLYGRLDRSEVVYMFSAAH